MKLKAVLFLLFSLLCVTGVTAQKKDKKLTIEGTVLNGSKEPIANAIIMIDDKKTNSLTDAEGNYKVKVPATAVKISVFTFGNGTMEDSINGRTKIDFNFSSKKSQQASGDNVAPGEEGVNTGYATIKKKNLTTDVNKIDGTNKKYASYSTISEMILREVSGARIQNGEVVLQGSQNLQGSIPALIVVDGVPMESMPSFPPVTVQSIEVLKGTSSAMYGSRGYGGVIIIKTKTKLE